MTPSVVLSRPSPCNVPQGYASVAELPAALPAERRVLARRGRVGENRGHFEHPARRRPSRNHPDDPFSPC